MEKLTPMMAQYREIKAQYEDCILMYRLGDFYEMFFDDAIEASKILQITLTSRNKGAQSKAPMCGVPFHAVDQYLSKLTRAGKKVALCDQVTEPTGKGIVERAVTRVVTPGTTFDDNILKNKSNNFVASLCRDGEDFGFAYADVTTGYFKVTLLKGMSNLEAELARVLPAEIICNEELINDPELSGIFQRTGNLHVFPFIYTKDAAEELKKHFGIKSLTGFGIENDGIDVLAAGTLFEYLGDTQKTDLKHIQGISSYALNDFMALDEACIRNLELLFTSRDGKRENSLIAAIDNTVCSMGGRLMRHYLLHPLMNRASIESRLKKVDIFFGNSTLLREIRDILGGIYDIERLLSKLSLGSGNARDLIAMRDSLKIVPGVKNLIEDVKEFSDVVDNLYELQELVELIDRGISEEAPNTVRDGGMIKNGFNEELDDLRGISTEGKTFIKDLQEREVTRTGISSLKVKFNKVFGYYIEISKSNLDAVPEDYIRKQTLVNAERYITPELKEYEEKVLNAEDRIKDLEYELFYGIRIEVVKEITKIQKLAKAIAKIDVLSTFAFNAVKFDYCRPEIVDENKTNGVLEIEGGRHPVVEQISLVSNFVPNDCKLSDSTFHLITGPNMGGKSTYLRQVALIALMSQIGSYVPAKSFKTGLVDRIFTRVGASDNLAKGESTFMVEMQEASYILNHATARSLIILDEVGRGTSTYDGVSIAWAIMEYIHDHIGGRTLFATHYHELTELADKLDKAKNMSVAVRENEGEGVVFLYKVVEGGVDKSYGIEVAKLAGLPMDVVSRARGVLHELETRHIQKNRVSPDQMGLFKAEDRKHEKLRKSYGELLKNLDDVDVNNLTPIEALHKLNEIKKKSSEV